jgi:Zn-dependent peptidase ImmA (M78 family)
MKSGIVKSNTHRALSPNEFQGFAIADRTTPVVFVNGRDYEVSAVFTLAHELAHIWLGETGVTDTPQSGVRGLERLCNTVAADLLVPRDEFLGMWRGLDAVEALASHFRVSRWVIAIRALELDKITQDQCDTVLQRRYPRRQTSGGNSFRTIPIRNSRRLTRELVASAMAGRTLIRHAAALLNVRADTVIALAQHRDAFDAE